MKAPTFIQKSERTRHLLLENYANKYAPHLTTPPTQSVESTKRGSSAFLRPPSSLSK